MGVQFKPNLWHAMMKMNPNRDRPNFKLQIKAKELTCFSL